LGLAWAQLPKRQQPYYASLEYASQRLQGRRLTEKDPNTPMIAIINHPDIKRMLLYQRAIVEGALSLAMQASYYEDLAKMGILSTSAAIQIHGGYGFCGDFPVEQYYRDIRIDTLHEGTTCIQGQDILGRKVVMKDGMAFAYFQDEIKNTIA
jgi:alkylation response protein AidB-like acyl-CoA dehydrogenase